MRGIAGKQMRGLPVGAELTCVDNSGAKIVKVVMVPKTHTVKRRYPAAGVGDLIMVSVKKGTPQMRKQVHHAVVVRQRRPFRRADGTMVIFEDNAAVITTDDGQTRGSDIKGPVAREAADRWPRIAALAQTIV